MAITAAVELKSKVYARNGSGKKADNPLGGRSIRTVAPGQRLPSQPAARVLALVPPSAQPASAADAMAGTAVARAIPKTEELPGALIEGQRKRIFYFILKHVKNHHDAEDLTQEALLQAYLSF